MLCCLPKMIVSGVMLDYLPKIAIVSGDVLSTQDSSSEWCYAGLST